MRQIIACNIFCEQAWKQYTKMVQDYNAIYSYYNSNWDESLATFLHLLDF